MKNIIFTLIMLHCLHGLAQNHVDANFFNATSQTASDGWIDVHVQVVGQTDSILRTKAISQDFILSDKLLYRIYKDDYTNLDKVRREYVFINIENPSETIDTFMLIQYGTDFLTACPHQIDIFEDKSIYSGRTNFAGSPTLATEIYYSDFVDSLFFGKTKLLKYDQYAVNVPLWKFYTTNYKGREYYAPYPGYREKYDSLRQITQFTYFTEPRSKRFWATIMVGNELWIYSKDFYAKNVEWDRSYVLTCPVNGRHLLFYKGRKLHIVTADGAIYRVTQKGLVLKTRLPGALSDGKVFHDKDAGHIYYMPAAVFDSKDWATMKYRDIIECWHQFAYKY